MELIGLKLPIIKEGDDLASMIVELANLKEGDIIVIAEKVVSKSEGRVLELEDISPSEKALKIASKIGKDPRLVEAILRESEEVLKVGSNFILTQTRHEFICANAGVDSSNIEEGRIKLLPKDPDESAKRIRAQIEKRTGKKVGVLISDSFGRPFRVGSVGVALGCSGVKCLWDRRGEKDIYGKKLLTTRVAVGDQIASATALVTGEADELVPVVIVRGLDLLGDGKARDLIRPKEEDLFRG